MTGTLYVVATPIGNLSDISMRALETLRQVDAVLAEDTRVTKKLLAHYDIAVPVYRCDASIEHSDKVTQFATDLSEGAEYAIVSDAGTPGVSDPGSRLVRLLQDDYRDVAIVPIPGASALTAALSVSGIEDMPILFLGFPPHKKGRKTFFEKIRDAEYPVVLYESVHRFVKTIETLHEYVPTARVGVFRELTKLHEEIIHGTPQEILNHTAHNTDRIRGEYVIVIEQAET